MKRSADNQLTKDNFEVESSDASHSKAAEGFEKAAPEVLSKRRIVKVRRRAEPKPSDNILAEAKPNPFSGLPAATTTSSSVAPALSADVDAKLAAEAPVMTIEKPSGENVGASGGQIASAAPANGELAADKALKETVAGVQGKNEQLKSENEADVDTSVQPVPENSAVKESAAEPSRLEIVPEKLSNDTENRDASAVDLKRELPATEQPISKDAAVQADTIAAKDEKLDTNSAPTEKPVENETSNEKPEANSVSHGQEAKSSAPELKDKETDIKSPDAPKPTPFTFGGAFPSGTTPFASFANAGAAEANKKSFSFSVPAFSATEKPVVTAGFVVGSASGTHPKFEESQVSTGEEDEKEVFRASKAKLFEFEDKKWKSRGVGTFKMNVPKTKGQPRVLMRTDATYRLILNSPVFPGFKLNRAGEKGVTFMNKEIEKVVSVKFLSKDDVGRLEKCIGEWKEKC